MNPREVGQVHLQAITLLKRSGVEEGLGIAKVGKACGQVIEGTPNLRVIG